MDWVKLHLFKTKTIILLHNYILLPGVSVDPEEHECHPQTNSAQGLSVVLCVKTFQMCFTCSFCPDNLPEFTEITNEHFNNKKTKHLWNLLLIVRGVVVDIIIVILMFPVRILFSTFTLGFFVLSQYLCV